MAQSTITAPTNGGAELEPTRQSPTYQPRFDIVENENELTLFGDLPGVEESGIDIRYENAQLIVIGTVEPHETNARSLRQEYGVGDFRRMFAIGESIDSEKINAEVHNGVLTIHLPKSEAAKPKKIAVKSV